MESLQALTAPILHRRRVCAVLWMTALAAGVLGKLGDEPGVMVFAWVFAMMVMFITAGVAKLTGDEQIVKPRVYRITAATLLGVALGGVALGLIPNTSGVSQAFAVFFGLVAFLAYRALVARGPRATMFAVLLAMWTWLPIAFLTLMGCRRGPDRYMPPWTEHATWIVLQVTLLVVVLLTAVALIAFKPRTDFMPDARAIRR